MQFVYLALGILALVGAALVYALAPAALVGDVIAMNRLASIGTAALTVLGVGCVLISCFPKKRAKHS